MFGRERESAPNPQEVSKYSLAEQEVINDITEKARQGGDKVGKFPLRSNNL